MAALDREIAAYDKMLPELESKHFGKWVVFKDDNFIGAFDRFEPAANEAVRRFGRGPFLIRQVGEPPIVLSAASVLHL
jgi:hypothetical protein